MSVSVLQGRKGLTAPMSRATQRMLAQPGALGDLLPVVAAPVSSPSLGTVLKCVNREPEKESDLTTDESRRLWEELIVDPSYRDAGTLIEAERLTSAKEYTSWTTKPENRKRGVCQVEVMDLSDPAVRLVADEVCRARHDPNVTKNVVLSRTGPQPASYLIQNTASDQVCCESNSASIQLSLPFIHLILRCRTSRSGDPWLSAARWSITGTQCTLRPFLVLTRSILVYYSCVVM